MKIQFALAAAAVLLGGALPSAAQVCDRSATSTAYAPAKNNFGMVMFEDRWPLDGDLDFNDEVFAYNFVFNETQLGTVTSLQVSVEILAAGANLDNALYLHIPVLASAVSSVVLNGADGVPHALTASATDTDLVVQLSADTRTSFGGQASFINSAPAIPAVAKVQLNLIVQFKAPVALDPAGAPYDLYIERTAEAGHQIHRPMYAGTSTMNNLLFRTGNDGSTIGVHFINLDGLPFALTLPQLIAWPAEGEAIDNAYPDVGLFASSGGTQNTSWYTSHVVTGLTWQGQISTQPSAPAVIAPVLPGVCAAVSATYPLGATAQSLAIDASGNVWVTKKNAQTISKLNTNGVLLVTSVEGAAPFGIAVAPDGTIWTSDFTEGTASRFDANGVSLGKFAAGSESVGIAIDAGGNVWIGNYGGPSGYSVTKLSAAGVHLFTVYGIDSPQFIAFDAGGNAWIGSQFSSSVTELGPAGNVIQRLSTGSSFPDALAFDLAGHLWVVDVNANAVFVLDTSSGATLGVYPSGGAGPYSMAFDKHGDAWVANIYDSTVGHICGTAACGIGTLLAVYPVGAGPSDIAIDAAGNVWTANTNGQSITKLTGAVN